MTTPPTPADVARRYAPDTLWQIPTPPETGVVHELRTWPAYFQAVWTRRKTFEVRYDDRGYQRGDRLRLREWDKDWPCTCEEKNHRTDCDKYTGREITAEIGYILAYTPQRGSQRGFNGNGYLVLSLCDPVNREPKKGDGRG